MGNFLRKKDRETTGHYSYSEFLESNRHRENDASTTQKSHGSHQAERTLAERNVGQYHPSSTHSGGAIVGAPNATNGNQTPSLQHREQRKHTKHDLLQETMNNAGARFSAIPPSANLTPTELDLEQEPLDSSDLATSYEVPEFILLMRSWKSMPLHLLLFFFLCIVVVELSLQFPELVLSTSFVVVSYIVKLQFPVLAILPACVLCHALYLTYNLYATIDLDNIMHYKGVLTMRREISEMEVATILSVMVKQNAWERLIGVGTICVGRFSRNTAEINVRGIKNPHKVAKTLKRMILVARIKLAQRNAK